MNKKNKNLLIIGGVTLVLIITLAVSYAFFSYSQTGNMNSKLIVGDIYMKYRETTTLTLNNAMPSDTYLENNYFEFSIDGKNTYTKEDIWYDISLTHGEPSTNENRTIRLDDKFLHFRLVEVIDGNEAELIQDKTYNSLDNKRIYVNTIPANTTEKVTHNYRLYMWIGNEVVIGNTSSANYSMEDWNKVYASIKVNVTGDFNEKELNPSSQSTPESCFITSDNGDNTVTVTGYVTDTYTLNTNMTNEELQSCVNYVTTEWQYKDDMDEGTTGETFCQGTGTNYGATFQGSIEQGYFEAKDLAYFEEHNIVIVRAAKPVECNTKDIIIPTSINNKTVTTIGSGAFSYNQLTSVEIPNSVTTIGECAFYENQLTSVEIGNSVTTIGNQAFFENQLTSVEIGNSVTTIGNQAFSWNQLTSVEIPNSVTTIGNYAFEFNQLTSVTIGNGIESINLAAFRKNTYNSNINLSSITIDKSCSIIKSMDKYPWVNDYVPYSETAAGVTVYGSNNEVCDTF